MANHYSQRNFTDDEIRQVLDHADVKNTGIYLRERIGVSPIVKIMKRFNDENSKN
jgi:hypothetical protein